MGIRTLLVVDDDENIVRSLVRTLRKAKLEVITSSNGPDALEILKQKEVGVIISDQRMPVMTGVEFLKKARILCPDTVRIVLSGYTELKSVTDSINQGEIFRFLTKPWEDDLLLHHIEEAFDIYDMRCANRMLTQEIKSANDELKVKNAELESLASKSQRDVIVSSTILQVSKEMIDKLPIGIIGVDSLGMIVFINRRGYELLAMTPGSLEGNQIEHLPSYLKQTIKEIKANPKTSKQYTASENTSTLLRIFELGTPQVPTGYVITMEILYPKLEWDLKNAS